MGTVYTTLFSNRPARLDALLDRAELRSHLAASRVKTILIKPNLVEALDPPVTTPVTLVDQLVRYLKGIFTGTVIIGEGTGAMQYDTRHCFERLGYTALARRHGIELIDLNVEEPVRLVNERCKRWPEMYLPEIAFESYLISVPVLKAHTLAGVTLTMKNMMGLVPPSHYRRGNSWKKSSFHDRIQDAIADLNRYRTPDFTLLDATVGMPEAHLWGPSCEPPVNRLAASYDPVAIDAYGAGLLEKNWENIGHIRTLHGELGTAVPLDVHTLETVTGT